MSDTYSKEQLGDMAQIPTDKSPVETNGTDDQLNVGLSNILSGVEKSLAATCEAIMDKMKHLEDRIQEIDDKFQELSKDADQALHEVETTVDNANVATKSNQIDEPKT